MKTATIGKHKVELYDSIEDLPITRYHKYNKMLLVDSGLGSDLTDVDSHIEKSIAFIKTGDNDAAIAEMMNMRKAIYFVQMSLSPKHLAFAALVKKIDGKEFNDLSDDGLRKVVDMLCDSASKDIVNTLDEAKKKIDEELIAYFPSMFDSAEVKEYYNLMKDRIMATLRAIKDNDGWEKVEDATNQLLTFSKPVVFDGTDSAEIECDKNFERMCLMMAQHLNIDAKKYTTLAFYNAYDYLRESLKKQNKLNGNGR